MVSDVVGVLLVVQESVLRVAEGTGRHVSGAGGAQSRARQSRVSGASTTSVFFNSLKSKVAIYHLLLGSGCRVTVACSTSALTSRVGNVSPSPWLQIRKTKNRENLRFPPELRPAIFYCALWTVIYLVKTGSSQYFFWSPKTWAMFFRKPKEKPFLSEPVLKTGALNASAERKRKQSNLYFKKGHSPDSTSKCCVWLVTYGGPVLPDQPQVVAEEGQDADAEHGRHKEEEQDVEFGVSVWQLVLRKRGKEGGSQ